LVYALLGIVGAESVIEDAVDALERRNVESQFVDALSDTLTSAVNQRSDDATIVVVISVGSAIYLASRWVRGVARGLDAVLDHEHAGSELRFLRQLRDTLVLLLLFIGALVLLFVGAGLANDLFGDALSFLWEVGVYLLAALLGAGAYAYIYWFVPRRLARRPMHCSRERPSACSSGCWRRLASAFSPTSGPATTPITACSPR
jgi:uncharacterized BrkB/YihY/UPF0761 family membrane protein